MLYAYYFLDEDFNQPPFAYFVVSRWLQNFFYQVKLGIEIFIFTGLIVLAIALLTISYQVIKTATTNPVDYLRYE